MHIKYLYILIKFVFLYFLYKGKILFLGYMYNLIKYILNIYH